MTRHGQFIPAPEPGDPDYVEPPAWAKQLGREMTMSDAERGELGLPVPEREPVPNSRQGNGNAPD